MKDHRGLTLVELIVVVAIITVLTGIAAMSISTISGLPAKKCAQQMLSSISKVRITTMGKKTDVLRITMDSDECIYIQEIIDGTSEQSKLVGKKGVTIKYTIIDSGVEGSETVMGVGDVLELSFDRSSGAFKEISPGKHYGKIISSKGGKEYSIIMVPATGKMSVSRN